MMKHKPIYRKFHYNKMTVAMTYTYSKEFGQWREWSEARELDWFLLNEPGHEPLRMFYRDLLHMSKKYPCLWEGDHDPNSFQWINCDDADRSIFSWIRKSKDGKDNLLFVCNFTPMERSDYKVGAPCEGKYTLVFDSRRGTVGYKESNRVYKAYKGKCDRQPCHIDYPLRPYGVAVFRFDMKKS